MKKFRLLLIILFCFAFQLMQAQYVPKPYSQQYNQMRDSLARGWNTWNTNSMLSHVLLPEGFAINLCLKSSSYVREVLPGVNRPKFVKPFKEYNEKDRNYIYLDPVNRREQVIPGLRSDDGSYTSLKISWDGTESLVESATIGSDVVLLVSVAKTKRDHFLVIESGFLWNREGTLSKKGEKLLASTPTKNIQVATTAELVIDNTVPAFTPYLSANLDGEIGIYTGDKERSLLEIKEIINKARQKQERIADGYKELADQYKAMQGVLAWNTIYDPENDRVITPVSRLWAAMDGGWVLFDWDIYFASYMFSMFNKDMAYTNAIAITKEITSMGFIPNLASTYKRKSFGHSQPPVGSFIVREIYRKYKEKWFLEEVYDELITWNKWWPKYRDNKGYLCWGSNKFNDKEYSGNSWQGAAYESGLDNTPMFDNVPFNKQTGMLEQADVGLMSFYIMDCDALADIAIILDKTEDAKELKARSKKYRQQLSTLWSEDGGIYLNKRTDSLMFNKRMSPTNFYPLIVGLPTKQQADRMIKEHYMNPDEFNGEYVIPSCPRNDPAFKGGEYWRGRIWGPMNFLVYLGLRKYEAADAKADMIQKSSKLFLQSWKENGAVYENYSAETGRGDDVQWSDAYYHWGALLGFISFIEKGYVPPMESNLPTK